VSGGSQQACNFASDEIGESILALVSPQRHCCFASPVERDLRMHSGIGGAFFHLHCSVEASISGSNWIECHAMK
jgi:hypothetical protein